MICKHGLAIAKMSGEIGRQGERTSFIYICYLAECEVSHISQVNSFTMQIVFVNFTVIQHYFFLITSIIIYFAAEYTDINRWQSSK
jgi:hypothetical protein